ncbi:MAG: hypothetical protein AB7G75_22500 [Candidatus Binatia bacterium]
MNAALARSWPEGTLKAATSTELSPATSALAEAVVMPDQFFVSAERSQIAWTPERRLLLAVLEDAVASFFRYRHDHSRGGKRLFRETQQWFDSRDRRSLYAFESICDHLHLDAAYLRVGLRRLPDPSATTSVSRNRRSRQPRQKKPLLAIVAASDHS